METVKQKLGKVSITVDKDEHSVDKEYDKLVVVYKRTAYTETVDGETVTKYNYRTYISRKPVPIGTEITNKDYWIQLGSVEEHIAIDYNTFKDEVKAFLNSFVTAENGRVSAEHGRVSNETSRIENENLRETQETTRKEHEDARQEAESIRQQQEGSPADEPDRNGSRWARYKRAEQSRDSNYSDKEDNRDADYRTSEQTRNNSYNTAEGKKTDTPNLNGSRWAQFKAKENLRQQDYEANEGHKDLEPDPDGSRWERYKDAEQSREYSFKESEDSRDTTFSDSEESRQNTFNTNEGTVNDTPSSTGSRWARFKFNEASRQTAEQTRVTNESNRQTQETARQQAESQRTSTFNQSQAERQQAYQNAEGTSSDEPSATGSRWARYNKAEQDRNAAIEDLKENKANKDGYYSQLVSGAAENLVGHGTTPAEYTFRTSGGTADIGTGAATIDTIKGKTLKFHQNIPNGNFGQGTNFWTGSSASISVVDGRLEVVVSAANGGVKINKELTSGNKYYLSFHVESPIDESNYSYVYFGNTNLMQWHYAKGKNHISKILSPTQDISGPMWIRFRDIDTFYLENVMLINLTTMFGAGNEPSTLEEFEALYPLDYYAYTATPVLINNAAKGIVTTGFNQYDSATGKAVVLGGHEYQITGTYTALAYSDGTTITPDNDGKFTPTKNDELTVTGGNATNTCIHLTWSGYKNGEYEPYEKHTLYFNGESGSLATVTGKKLVNGEPTGDSVTIFPDGMKSAGSVYDFGKADSDGYIRKVTKRIGVLDLGSYIEDYAYSGETGHSRFGAASILGTLKFSGEVICTQYSTGEHSNSYQGNMIVSTSGTSQSASRIWFWNDNYTDAATFKTAMSGVMLYYELATPEEYLLDTPIPANYLVNDFGTEQRIPIDTASNVMAPVLYDVKYSMNAVDTVRRLPITYIKKESMDNFIIELASKLGTFLDATITITPSYDAMNEEYDYSITITQN